MKILFARPPRYRWPFHSEKSSFWQPLGFASMAAVLRENTDGLKIKILDFPAHQQGWKTARDTIAREKPDILCIGEETVSADEALKLASIAKEIRPDCTVIAGGHHFTYMEEDTLANHSVDYIVRFEGEMTLLELVKTLQKEPRPNSETLKRIKGIAFAEKRRQDDGKGKKRKSKNTTRMIKTEPRELLDMETLPMPAYDLLDMRVYGKGARSHPDLVAIEHSRGCTGSCSFCTLWKQFGSPDQAIGAIRPCYRTKSAKKSAEEAIELADRYKRKTFCWVDPTWNAIPKWNREFAQLMQQHGRELDHSVWLRADFLIRDEKEGTLKELVKAGMKQAMIGIERTDNNELSRLNKTGYSYETTKKAFETLRRYPQVLSIATYIYGTPEESKESMRRFYRRLGEIPFDVGIPIPLTPNPGTQYFQELDRKGLLEVKDFRYYNFVNPVARSKHMGRNRLLLNMLTNEFRVRTRKEQFAKDLKDRRKTATGNVAKSKTAMTMRFARGMLQESILGRPYNYNIKPEWYDR